MSIFGTGACDQEACECPPTCKVACAKHALSSHQSPRVDDSIGYVRPYTAILNAVLRDWGTYVEVPAEVRLTYCFLVTWTTAASPRWIYARFKDLARSRGVTLQTFREHLKELDRLRLVSRIRKKDIDPRCQTNDLTIVILDLPSWFPSRDAHDRASRDRVKARREARREVREVVYEHPEALDADD